MDRGTSTWGRSGSLLEGVLLNPCQVCMANTGQKDSNGCQFYITFDGAPWLDGDNVIIGKVRMMKISRCCSTREGDVCYRFCEGSACCGSLKPWRSMQTIGRMR